MLSVLVAPSVIILLHSFSLSVCLRSGHGVECCTCSPGTTDCMYTVIVVLLVKSGAQTANLQCLYRLIFATPSDMVIS